MDVIVWAESEEREQWWRQVMGLGLAPVSARGVRVEAEALTTSGFSPTSRVRVSTVRSIHGVTAA